ncbi:MAG: IS1634 family transposase [Terriglobia bacterium]
MYVAVIPNRSSPPAILLRESYREAGKVKNRTLANLSAWPPEKIQALREVLRGERGGAGGRGVGLGQAFEVVGSRPHGHVAAVVGTLRKLGLEAMLASRRSRHRQVCVAMIAARVVEPCSKLATARAWNGAVRHNTLGEVCGVEGADEDDLYAAMDWLLERQERIERQLAKRHLGQATFVLYDVTSTYFEGRCCRLARLGHSRDGKKGTRQIVFGVLANAEGCPVAVEVFAGNTGDPKTLSSQVRKLRERFGLTRLVMVGDRGMITAARIREDLEPAGIDWITALRAPAIRKLAEAGVLQPSLFDERDLAEITSPEYPGERLIVCKNPLLAHQRSRKRDDLLQATEHELDKVVQATRRDRNKLKGQATIALRVGKVLGRFKMGKHFCLHITETGFTYQRDEQRIAQEAALDGIYVIRTSVSGQSLGAQDAVRRYKQLAGVERAFRSLKTMDLKVRPIHHRLSERVRAHVLVCLLAYYVEWHMRKALAPMLFDEDDPAGAASRRRSVVAPAQRSEAAHRKARTKRTVQGHPVHSFQSLLKDLATVVKNHIEPTGLPGLGFDKITVPSNLQHEAFDRLGVSWRM